MDVTEQWARGSKYRRWMRYAYEQGYHPSYGSAMYIKTYGQKITNKPAVGRGAVFGKNPTWFDKRDYITHLVEKVNTNGGPYSKAEEYYKVEFRNKPMDDGFELTVSKGKLILSILLEPPDRG